MAHDEADQIVRKLSYTSKQIKLYFSSSRGDRNTRILWLAINPIYKNPK